MNRRRGIELIVAGILSLATLADGADAPFSPEGYDRLAAHVAAEIQRRLPARR